MRSSVLITVPQLLLTQSLPCRSRPPTIGLSIFIHAQIFFPVGEAPFSTSQSKRKKEKAPHFSLCVRDEHDYAYIRAYLLTLVYPGTRPQLWSAQCASI